MKGLRCTPDVSRVRITNGRAAAGANNPVCGFVPMWQRSPVCCAIEDRGPWSNAPPFSHAGYLLSCFI